MATEIGNIQANNQMEESHAVISLLPLRFHEYLVAQT